jgi:transposase
LQPRLDQAGRRKRRVFFVDASHFVWSTCLGVLWGAARMFVPAPSGRQRYNVLAALNATTHELITVTNTTYITSQEVCLLLYKLARSSGGLPISVVLDNARYQHCQLVQEIAAALQIELCFLPSYSPNLNLIERLWKFVKKQCLASVYHATFAQFRAAINSCLMQTHTTHKTALDTLLTLRFQSFDEFKKAQLVPV